MQLESPFPEPEKAGEKQGSDKSMGTGEARKRHRWRWAALALFLIILVLIGVGVSDKGRDVVSQLIGHAPPEGGSLFNRGKQEPSVVPEEKEKYEAPKVNIGQTEVEPGETSPAPQEKAETGVVSLARAVETKEAESSPVSQKEEPLKSLVVKPGDTLLELVIQVYGTANETIIDLIRQSNPAIKDINRIEVGQEILFPPLKAAEKKGTFTVHIASFKAFQRARDYFQELVGAGYEAYIIPANDPVKGAVFRIALGSFESREDGDAYAALILNRRVSDYAETIELEMK